MDLVVSRVFHGTDPDRSPAVPFFAHAVADGVLNQGLQGEGGYSEVGTFEVIFNLQSVAETEFLQGDIVVDMVKLLLKWNRPVDGD